MKREFLDYLCDIADSVDKIASFTEGMTFEIFRKDEKAVFAVVRALEIIGEASKKIPASVKQKNPGIPWNSMAGMRDKLIHEYFGVDVEIVWKTVRDELPPLKPILRKLIEDQRR
ncbi:MAG: DUF86 domain-containing protein [Candidatus Micrarchaeota archaeon]